MRLTCYLGLIGTLAWAALSGCVTIREEPVWARPKPANRAPVAAGAPATRSDTTQDDGQTTGPAPVSRTSAVRAALVPLGAVPYDDFSLPIVSPDGRYIATQTGAPPTWPTALAAPEGVVPEVTRVEIWQTDLRTDLPAGQQRQPTLAAIIDQPALLGRSCDETGFLIEAPQPDGSRWIGKVGWATGEISWLIQDDNVNAFAALGPDGRLAWSRRAIDGDHFELVILNNRVEWSLGQPGEDWLMPVWGGLGDGLFVLQLTESEVEQGAKLHALYMRTSSKAGLNQTLRRLFLADGADINTAMQTIAGQVNSLSLPVPALDQLVFLHPTQLRMAIWRPLASEVSNTPILLVRRSIAAVVDQPSVALVSTDKALFHQQITGSLDVDELLKGTVIARPVGGGTLQYILLGISDKNPGQIGVTGLRLEPI